MPVAPLFEWEQSGDAIFLRVTIKGFKSSAIDVFISDQFVKVNASPVYLLQLDLLNFVVIEKSSFRIESQIVKITLQKAEPNVWPTLCIDAKTPHSEVQKRRAEALERAEALYNTKLDTREKQKEVEKKRMLNEQWEIEAAQRREIEARVKEERESEQRDLYEWEESRAARVVAPKTPGDIFTTPPVRQEGQTKHVAIDFSPKPTRLPIRSRGDEDYYRKSRYKPVRIEDSPMFWKEKGDKLYHACDWRGAADAYSESIKRDGCFLTCVSNRAACYLRMHEYQRAINDCDLAINMVANTPASDTTQDIYRRSLTRLYARRGAAYCWNGDMNKGLEDYRVAAAYRSADDDTEIVSDIEAIRKYMSDHSMLESRDPVSIIRSDASTAHLAGNYAKAAELYEKLLQLDEFDYRARSNLSATLLHQGAFQRALDECTQLISFCGEVANALNEPGVQAANLGDSDDEDEPEDEFVARKNAAAKMISERSGHVYLLLKSYVRAGAAYCGLRDYRSAFDMFEKALRITPYDDDLRDDANRILEKLKFDTLVGATRQS